MTISPETVKDELRRVRLSEDTGDETVIEYCIAERLLRRTTFGYVSITPKGHALLDNPG